MREILSVANHHVTRNGVCLIFESISDIILLAEPGDGLKAFNFIRRSK